MEPQADAPALAGSVGNLTQGGAKAVATTALGVYSLPVSFWGSALQLNFMAYYGIPSAGLTLTASMETTPFLSRSLAEPSSLLSLFTVPTVTTSSTSAWPKRFCTANYSAISGIQAGTTGTGGIIASLNNGSATYTTSTSINPASGLTTGTVSFTTAVTSQNAARIVNQAYFQGNVGNDSIAFGERLTTVSATTFAGGQGNDVIGTYTNLANAWTAGTTSATFTQVDIEGGKGNDTISLNGNAVYSALNVNANAGADVMTMDNISGFYASKVGLGADGDILSGVIGSATTSTIVGGLGNDTIVLDFTNVENTVFGGDRDTAVGGDTDGNDSIFIKDAVIFSANTIYGGGGNDTITFSAQTLTDSVVNTNAGFDVFSAHSGVTIKDSTIGLGNQGDIFKLVDSSQFLSSRLNLGKGLDSTYFGDTDVASGTDFASTTIYGGAGADYLIGSAADLADTKTAAMVLLYENNSESTISAYDTIAVNTNDGGSGSYLFRYEPGASLAAFSAAGLTGTNGVVTFSSTFATDVTARVAAISSNTSSGNAAAFTDGSGNAYLFVKGSTDVLVQAGSAVASGIAGLAINASKNMTLTLNG